VPDSRSESRLEGGFGRFEAGCGLWEVDLFDTAEDSDFLALSLAVGILG